MSRDVDIPFDECLADVLSAPMIVVVLVTPHDFGRDAFEALRMLGDAALSCDLLQYRLSSRVGWRMHGEQREPVAINGPQQINLSRMLQGIEQKSGIARWPTVQFLGPECIDLSDRE